MLRPELFLSTVFVISLDLWGEQLGLLGSEAFARDDILLAFGRVEVDGQLDALGHVDSQRQVALLLQILKSEPFQVLFRKRFGIQGACLGRLLAASFGRCAHVASDS
jgi:hypothetical protein